MVTIKHEYEIIGSLSFDTIIGITLSPTRTELNFSSFRPICQQLTAIGGALCRYMGEYGWHLFTCFSLSDDAILGL